MGSVVVLCALGVVAVALLAGIKYGPSLLAWARRKFEKGEDSPAGDDAPASPDAPAPADAPAESPDVPKGCPDGSGTCPSDDYPPVAFVPIPDICKHITEADFKKEHNIKAWQTGLPIIGPLWAGIDAATGNMGIMADLMSDINAATLELKEAGSQWENAYAKFLGELSKDILPATEALLDPNEGLVQLSAETAAMPLLHAAYMLVSPIVAMLACATIIVWIL